MASELSFLPTVAVVAYHGGFVVDVVVVVVAVVALVRFVVGEKEKEEGVLSLVGGL